MESRKQAISKDVLKRLIKTISEGNKIRLTLVIISIIISSIVSVTASIFMKTLIDDYIMPLLGKVDPSYDALARALLMMAAIYVLGIIANFTYNRLMIKVAQGTLKKIRDTMFSKMQSLPIRYFDTNTHGDVMSHYTNDTDTLEQMISQSLPTTLSSLITLLTVIVSMISMSWQLSLFVFSFVIIMLFVTKKITGKSARYFVGQQKSLGTVNGYIEEMINGQKVVKVFNYEDRAKDNFDKLNEELFKNTKQAHKFSNILMPILANLGNIEYVLVAILGATLAINNIVPGLTIGTIASFLTLTRSFNMPINQISMQINSIVMALAGAKRIFELIDEEKEKDEGYVTLVNAKKDKDGNIIETKDFTGMWAWKHPHKKDGTVTYTELLGRIDMEDVDFAYEEGKTVLHDISLYAKPGQKIAFVGATGAGKTTITNLLNRFYDIEKGKIRYDGINIKKIKKEDLRRSLGLVLQDTNLFTGTIKENIKYGKLDATDEEVIEAAKIANAHDFIEMLPDGYDTMLTENGAQLSQGQRQLLAIARCAINNPPVMILDEATSSIDTRTEKIVQDGMDKLMQGRTVFVIAHRLSTVRNSKAIMVLEKGRIIERGTHEQLLEQKGEYYELYTGAFELE